MDAPNADGRKVMTMTAWPSDIGSIAGLLVEPAKGILAADESTGTIEKRFRAIGLESTLETRRAYRNLLFATPGIEAHISGVILFDETIRQAADNGTPFAELLTSRGSSPASRSTAVPSRWPAPRTRRLPRASTACASVSPSIANSALASRNGGPSSASGRGCRPTTRSA